MTGDLIEKLPTDSIVPSHEEIEYVNVLFKKNPTLLDRLKLESKNIVLLAILFIVVSLPIVDKFILNLSPVFNNWMYLILVKTLLIVILYVVLTVYK